MGINHKVRKLHVKDVKRNELASALEFNECQG